MDDGRFSKFFFAAPSLLRSPFQERKKGKKKEFFSLSFLTRVVAAARRKREERSFYLTRKIHLEFDPPPSLLSLSCFFSLLLPLFSLLPFCLPLPPSVLTEMERDPFGSVCPTDCVSCVFLFSLPLPSTSFSFPLFPRFLWERSGNLKERLQCCKGRNSFLDKKKIVLCKMVLYKTTGMQTK